MDLSEFSKTEVEGTIVNAYTKTLREYLKTKKNPVLEKVIDESFNNPDRLNVIVIAEVEGSAVDAFFMVPQNRRGWEKSNLKRFIEKNSLAMVDTDNPKDFKKWLGKKVAAKIDAKGYYRIAV